MPTHLTVQGVLLDSGGTLVQPIGGEWFPGPAFRTIVAARRLRGLRWDQLDRALAEGMAYLHSNHHLTTEEEECAQLQEYFTRVFQELGLATPPPALTREIAVATIGSIGMEPYSDALPALERMQTQGLRLGIISNSWPSLDRRFRQLGLRRFFDPFVVSAQVGCLKPDPQIFRLALKGIGLPASSVLYVDDSPAYVEAARSVGMHGLAIARDGRPPGGGIPWVTSLSELDGLLTPSPAGA